MRDFIIWTIVFIVIFIGFVGIFALATAEMKTKEAQCVEKLGEGWHYYRGGNTKGARPDCINDKGEGRYINRHEFNY